MNPEIKTRWVEALRNGKYRQGQWALHQNDSFCCLGVLCDLVKDEIGARVEVVDTSGTHIYDGSLDTLPKSVQLYAGLESDNPALGDRRICSSVNDHEGLTFSEIADLIEEYL